MRKKSLVVLAMAAAMVFGGAITAHAEETQWYTELSDAGYPMSHVEENLAQADAWAEKHKGNIADIANVEERYAAVVNEVISFLDYDVNYMSPMMYYTIRDEKGVCCDYTLLTGTLCEKVGIEHSYEGGKLLSAGHPILKVNINGDWRYSDPTNYESGAVGLFGAVNGWVAYEGDGTDKRSVASSCGMYGDEMLKLSQQKMSDKVLVKDRYGNEAWVLVEDAATMKKEDFLSKYGLRQ